MSGEPVRKVVMTLAATEAALADADLIRIATLARMAVERHKPGRYWRVWAAGYAAALVDRKKAGL